MTSNKHTSTASKSVSLVKLGSFAVILGGAIWGLVTLFQPTTNLEPYNKYKKVSTVTEGTGDSSASSGGTGKEKTTPEGAGKELNEQVAQVQDQTDTDLDLKKELEKAKPKAFDNIQLPRQTMVHISKGVEYTEQGKYNHADIEFEKASKLSPNAPEVYSLWATSLRVAGKYEGANKRFARAHELAPNDEEIVFNWGMMALVQKNGPEAIRLFKETVNLNPKHYLGWNYLGKAYGLKKDYRNEEKSYVKSLAIKEDFAQAHFNLAVTRSIQKNFEGASQHFVRAIELDKQFEKPFVVQFLTAMGLKDKTSMKQADLKEVPKKEQAAKLETEPKKPEGSDHKMEGSNSDVIKTITHLKGQVKINGQPSDARGVVFLETKNKLKVPKQSTQQITITQKNLQFMPSHEIVMVGSTITFINDDTEVHNIFSRSLGNQFNLGAMAGGARKEIKVTAPGPVVLRCNMHKDMVGTLFVAPNGYVTSTDSQGNYDFPYAKSQEYVMAFWHPQLYPEEVEHNAKVVGLTGADTTLDLDIKSNSNPGEIHDLVDRTDYNLLVNQIESEMNKAIDNWKSGKKRTSQKRMIIAITRYFDGGGLKSAIAKSFSIQRSENLEKGLDEIRKKISGLDKSEPVTEASLKFKAERVVAQLRNNVKELENRLKPAEPK